MNFRVNPRIFRDFDNPRIAVTVARGVNNSADTLALQQQLNQLTEMLRQNFDSRTLSKEPKIAAWRVAHRAFGSNPKDYPSSVEALYKRVLKGQRLGAINPLA